MVRLTIPEEFKIIENIKKHRLQSIWADFDTTREDIENKHTEEIETRMEILLNPTLELQKMETRYESITGERLPQECSNIIGRFENSCERIYLEYNNRITQN
jgi:hypothetical protein